MSSQAVPAGDGSACSVRVVSRLPVVAGPRLNRASVLCRL